jgi:toxin ParE1/3/4
MPTKFEVRVSRRAQSDIDEIWTFIARDSVTEANRFINQLERQHKSLRRFPERCPLIPENLIWGTRYRHLIYGKYRTIFRRRGNNRSRRASDSRGSAS